MCVCLCACGGVRVRRPCMSVHVCVCRRVCVHARMCLPGSYVNCQYVCESQDAGHAGQAGLLRWVCMREGSC